MQKNRWWSKEEIETLKKVYSATETHQELIDALPCKKLSSILSKAKELKLKRGRYRLIGKGLQKQWKDEELNLLKEHFVHKSNDEIQELLPERTIWAIYRMAVNLGLKRGEFYNRNKSKVKPWTDEEFEIVKKYYPSSISNDELMEFLPGRTFQAVKTIARTLGVMRGFYNPAVKSPHSRRWTKSEIAILKKNYMARTDQELLELLPERTIMSIKHAARKMGFPAKEPELSIVSKSTSWTENEKHILYDYFPTAPNEELLDLLPGRSIFAIKTMARKMGITRGKNVWASTKKFNPWSEEEVQLLIDNINKVTFAQLCELIPGRTADAIWKRAKKMQIVDSSYTRY